jgi:hypothetical protein
MYSFPRLSYYLYEENNLVYSQRYIIKLTKLRTRGERRLGHSEPITAISYLGTITAKSFIITITVHRPI